MKITLIAGRSRKNGVTFAMVDAIINSAFPMGFEAI